MREPLWQSVLDHLVRELRHAIDEAGHIMVFATLTWGGAYLFFQLVSR